MAATSAIAIGVGSTAYNAIEANQQRQRAKGQAAAILRTAPDANAAAQSADTAALDAQAKKRQQLSGTASANNTVLTGPSGVFAPPPATKTLLGL